MSRVKDPSEMNDVEYLRDLSERLMGVPAMYGTDQYDCDRLNDISQNMEAINAPA